MRGVRVRGACGTRRDSLLGFRALGALGLISLIAATQAACQGGARLIADAAPAADTAGDANGPDEASDARDAGATRDTTGDIPCRGALDAFPPFGPCTETFADTGWVATECNAPVLAGVWEQTCDGYRTRTFSYATHTKTCYYDPASGALVAADFSDDTPTFCGFTVWRLILGNIPAPGSCAAERTMLPDPCSSADGGAR